MKTEIVDVSATRKEFKIEIDAAEVRAEYDRVSGEYARKATVPGFRKGHAPASVVRTRYKKEISGEVLQKLVPEAVNRALEESGLRVLGQPDVHLAPESIERLGEAPVSLHAHVEVLPDVELGEYKGLSAARRTRPVTDEMVEQTLAGLRESSASLQPVEERGAESGDTVTVNFHGRFVEPAGAEDITADDVDVVLGGEGVQEDFNANLMGARADEEKTFTVKYPEDFSSKGLAGKTVDYTAKVVAVSRKELPELDDEWAKSLGEEIDSVESLRRRVRENLEGRAKFEAEGRVRDEVVGRLVDAHKFELPESLVEYQTNQMLQTAVRDMIRHGLDPRAEQFDWEALRGGARERAEEELRASMLLETIAERENIDVTDEEVEEEIKMIAEASRQTVEQVRAALTKQGGATSIADSLRNRKAVDLLVEKANVSEEEWREEKQESEVTSQESE
ncbi:MAG TPA: trigger factor [Pyrinomonadaceae bacterium]